MKLGFIAFGIALLFAAQLAGKPSNSQYLRT
jgi:hypothetical protein